MTLKHDKTKKTTQYTTLKHDNRTVHDTKT